MGTSEEMFDKRYKEEREMTSRDFIEQATALAGRKETKNEWFLVKVVRNQRACLNQAKAWETWAGLSNIAHET